MIDNFKGEYRPLSNFWMLRNHIMLPEILGPADGYQYLSVEKAYQAAKSLNMTERYDISHMGPRKAKEKGRSVIIRPDWESVKQPLMLDLVRQKFYKNAELRVLLVSTGDQELIEGNYWHDNFWGSCSCNQCQAITGKNWLGKILMHIRKEVVG